MKPIQSITALLDDEDLILKSVNDVNIRYDGWVELDIRLEGWKTDVSMNVPFLVTAAKLPNPIIGTNVIEEVVNNPELFQGDNLLNNFKTCFKDVEVKGVEALINKISRCQSGYAVKTGKRTTIIPKHTSTHIRCHGKLGNYHDNIHVFFEPSIAVNLPEELEIHESIQKLFY